MDGFLRLAETVGDYGASGFDVEWAMGWLGSHWYLCFFFVAAYLLTIFSLQSFMAKRPAFELRWPLMMWNISLALYSIIGFLSAFPDIYHSFRTNGYRASYLKRQGYYEGPMGFWAFVFLLSKVAELGDSVFIVLRKRPLIFLQWYHHSSVLVYTWLCYTDKSASMRWCWTNVAVHAVMYSYFAARGARVRLPSWSGMLVTSLQLLQFIVCLAVCLDTALTILAGQPCEVSTTVCVAQLGMYLSYFLLFAQFFYKSYIAKPRPKTA